MALKQPELFTSTSAAAMKRFYPTNLEPKRFANVGGGPTLAVGTPVAYDTSAGKWKVWANGGSNEVGIIRGFVWPDPIVLDATDDVLGVVMLKGMVHFDDIVVTGGTLAQLKTAVQDGAGSGAPTLRELGIDVQGLVKIH